MVMHAKHLAQCRAGGRAARGSRHAWTDSGVNVKPVDSVTHPLVIITSGSHANPASSQGAIGASHSTTLCFSILICEMKIILFFITYPKISS